RPPGNRALPPAQRQIHPTRRIRLPPPPAPQMDHAHLLQCPGRNLPILARRNRSNARSAPAAGKIHRPALPSPLRSRHSHLHRGIALLRRQSLAGLPERRPPYLKASVRAGAGRWGLDFAIANPAGWLMGSYSTHSRTSPALTAWPSAMQSFTILPLLGERISFCIFIASTTIRPWPASTVSPCLTSR